MKKAGMKKTKILYFPIMLFLIIFIFSICVSAEEMYIDVSDDDCCVRGLYADTEASSDPGTNCLGFGTQNAPQTCFRTLVFFNTSVLGNAVILNATIVFRINLAWCAGGDFNVTVQRPISSEYPHMPPIRADFNRDYYTGNGGEKNTSTITAFYPYYFNITLNADGISWINTNNWTKFCLRSSMDLQEAPYTYTFKTPYSHETPSERAKLYVEYIPGENNPPNVPSNENPSNNSDYESVYDCYLKANVTDPDGDDMDVSFYWGDGTLIATVSSVTNNTQASIYLPDYIDPDWLDHNTDYTWYVNVSDGEYTTQGPTWTSHTSMAWDCNEDRIVNYLDISILVSHYLESCLPGEYGWDIIEDGDINYLDISSLVSHYGESY